MADELRQQRVVRFGWVPDLPDARDHLYSAPIMRIGPLPANVDLRAQCPAVYDQGQLGSCTANAIGGAVEFDRLKQKLADWVPSRLFIYYNERVIEHSVPNDAGAQIRDGIKVVAKLGACDEQLWSYDISKFADKPPAAAFTAAAKCTASSYARVARSLNQMKGCLASGFPFVFGFTVYDAFEGDEVAKTGVLNMPDLSKEKVVGGHAVLAVGYDEPSQRFIVRNSWGPNWGQKGYFTIPYAYLLDDNLSDDFWTVRLLSD
jgi:C1A family cysteine protease